MRRVFSLIAVAVFVSVLITAGCVQTLPPVSYNNTATPPEMYTALNDLATDLVILEYSLKSDMLKLSREIETKDAAGITASLEEYYFEHPCLTAVIYYDNLTGTYFSEPVFLEINFAPYSANLTEKDFQEAGGVVVRNNLFTRYHGYQNLYYKAVYDADGSYRGYLIFVVDVYSLLYLHPDMLDMEKSYGGYICFITDEDRKILYSSIEEATGDILPLNGFYDGLAYIPVVESGDGACTYSSRGFFSYDSEVQTQKITAWHTLYSSHGTRYTLYLVSRPDLPALSEMNDFAITSLQALNDTRGALVYANRNGQDKLVEQITSGYYATPMALMDMDGNVIASSDSRMIGNNYLNNRGMYGFSYIEAAIHAAQQGGGYIYYLTPVERVVTPRAAQYTLGIVIPVNTEYYLFSWIAGSEDVVMMDPSIRSDLTILSRAVLEEIGSSGISAVVDMINMKRSDAVEKFVPGLKTEIHDVAILDFNGNVTASMKRPYLVGQSSTYMVDVYGDSLTRRAMMLAKTGGGFMALLVKNPDQEGMVDLCLSMIQPATDNYYVYTSVFLETFEDVLTPYLKLTEPTV